MELFFPQGVGEDGCKPTTSLGYNMSGSNAFYEEKET